MSTSTKENLKLDTLQLFQEYKKSKTLHLRNQIMELNIGLVRKEAYYWLRQCGESYDDLLQIGCLGLIRAIERFDSTKGFSFSSFALCHIRGEIQHYLRNNVSSVKIPRQWIEIKNKSSVIRRNFIVKFNRQPTDLEIAEILEISLQKWQRISSAWRNKETQSLDASLGSNQDETISLVDLIPDSQYSSFQLNQEDKINLQCALANLEKQTRNIVESVFLHDLTQKEVAKRLGFSTSTVARHLKKGLALLKQSMSQEPLEGLSHFN